MKPEMNMLIINAFFGIITIIAFVRFISFQNNFAWLCLIVIIWICVLISIERAKKERYHERLYVKRKKK